MILKWLIFGLYYAAVFYAGFRAGIAHIEDKCFEFTTEAIKMICRRHGLNVAEEVELNIKEVKQEAEIKARREEQCL